MKFLSKESDNAMQKYLNKFNIQRKQANKDPVTLEELIYLMKNGLVKIQKHSDHTGYIDISNNIVCEKCGYPIISLLQGNKYTIPFDRDVYEIAYCSNIYCENHKPKEISFMERNTFGISKDRYMYKTLSVSDSIDFYRKSKMI